MGPACKDDLIARNSARKEEVEQQMKALKARQEEDERKSREPLDACEAKLKENEKQLVALDIHNFNHIVFAFDKSGSMDIRHGVLGSTSWTLALEAADAFRRTLLSRGSQDKVSTICFNGSAKCLAQCVPVSKNFVEQLRNEERGGGTCFASAWEKIKERANAEPKLARFFTVFLSDGLSDSWDIAKAAKIAKEIHESVAQERSMCTIFVHIAERGGNTVTVQESLEPLVKAANGGQTFLELGAEKINLLQLVKAEDLTRVFEDLTKMVNLQHSFLETKVSMLRSLEKEYKVKNQERTKELKERYAEKSRELEEAKRDAENMSKSDEEELTKRYRKLEEDMGDEVKKLTQEHNSAQERVLNITQGLETCKGDLEDAEKLMESAEKTSRNMLAALQKLQDNHVTQVNQIGMKQQSQLENFGTTSSKLLLQELDGLTKMKEQIKRNSAFEQDF